MSKSNFTQTHLRRRTCPQPRRCSRSTAQPPTLPPPATATAPRAAPGGPALRGQHRIHPERRRRPRCEPFPMTQVKLLAGVYHDAQEWNRALHAAPRRAAPALQLPRRTPVFRPGDAKPFGGWEAARDGQRGSELRGHFTGHFLSASAQLYAPPATRTPRPKATRWSPNWPSARRSSAADT